MERERETTQLFLFSHSERENEQESRANIVACQINKLKKKGVTKGVKIITFD